MDLSYTEVLNKQPARYDVSHEQAFKTDLQHLACILVYEYPMFEIVMEIAICKFRKS